MAFHREHIVASTITSVWHYCHENPLACSQSYCSPASSQLFKLQYLLCAIHDSLRHLDALLVNSRLKHGIGVLRLHRSDTFSSIIRDNFLPIFFE